MAEWNSIQYLKFKKERTQPAIDLAGRIDIDEPRRIIDIGCGPGNSTKVLTDKYPKANITGIDNSENMITSAKNNYPDLAFILCDITKDLSKAGCEYDVVFSNACIQWVPDHKDLIANLMKLLKKGGILAVQIPMNYNEPIHKIIGEVSTSAKWKSFFSNPRIFYTLQPEEYFDILSELSGNFSIWETTYYHVMKSHSDILEWYKSTGLRPYLDALTEDKKSEFEEEIMENLIRSYPVQKNGDIIFRFPRFFFTVQKN